MCLPRISGGVTVKETVAALADRGSVAAIGPAGENGVLFANIMMGEGNSVGRGGLGAVMGWKRLKAIVVNGTCRTTIADEQLFDSARADVMRLFKASPVIFGELGIAEYGTPALVDLMRQRRMAPTENFSKTVFEGSADYSGTAIRRDCAPKRMAVTAVRSSARRALLPASICPSMKRFPISAR